MATIMLRHVERDLWDQFRARADAEGVGPRELMLRIMTAYVKTAGPTPRPAPPAPPEAAMHTCGNCGRRFKVGTTCPHTDAPWTAPPRRV